MKLNFLKENKQKIINITIFLVIFLFLIYYFKPSLIFSKTITTGGDMDLIILSCILYEKLSIT